MFDLQCFDLKDRWLDDPQAGLERAYIESFLNGKGYMLKDISSLPQTLAKQLMTEACKYASNKLAEVETRSRLVNDIHGYG